MRILAADSDLLAAAGRQRAFVEVVRGLTDRGHSIDVFYRDPGPLNDELPEGCRTVQVPGFLELLSKSPTEQFRLVRSVLAAVPGHYDLVCVNRPELCAFAVMVGTLKRIPSFCFLRDHRFGYSKRSKFTLGLVTHRLAVSQFIRNHYILNVGQDPARTHLVYSGVDTSYYQPSDLRTRALARQRFGIPSEAFVILYAGRIDWTKGIDQLIDAFKLLATRDQSSYLVIAGGPDIADHSDQPTREGMAYLAALQEMTASTRCLWVGSVMDVRPLYQAADVAVVPSRAGEAFARAVLEPMSAGIPTLASINGGNPEALQSNFSEFLFEVGDSATLAQKLNQLKGWREHRPQLAQACREHVLGSFSVQRTLDSVERLFIEAVQSKPGGLQPGDPSPAPKS